MKRELLQGSGVVSFILFRKFGVDKDPAVIPATQMPSFKIAVVEDSDGTRGILGERLTEQLEEASPGSLPAWPNAGTISFEMAPLPRESVERLAEVTTVEEATSILEDLFEDGGSPGGHAPADPPARSARGRSFRARGRAVERL
jgi:hypothetical protein